MPLAHFHSLKESQKKIWSSIPFPFFITNSASQIIFSNSAFCSAVGFTADELNEISLTKLLNDHPKSVIDFRQSLKTQSAINKLKVELSLKAKDNPTLNFKATISSLTFEYLPEDIFQFFLEPRSVLEIDTNTKNIAEKRLALFKMANEDTLWSYNLAKDNVTWDESFSQTFGIIKGEDTSSLGAWESRVHPDDRAKISEMFRTLVSGDIEVARATYRFKKNDGSYATVDDRCYAFKNEQNQVTEVYGALKDISASRAAQDELKQSEVKFRKLFENAFIGIAMLDVDQGTWLDCNQALLNILGYSKDELLNMKFLDLSPKDQKQKDAELLEIFREEGTIGTVQKEFKRRDGNITKAVMSGFTSILPSGKDVGWVHLLDISQLDKTTEVLRLTEDRFKHFIENASDTFAILNSEGNYTYISPKIKDLLGYKPEEVIGKNNFFLIHPLDHEEAGNSFASAYENIGMSSRSVFRCLHKNGSIVWAEANGRFAYNNNDELTAYLIVREQEQSAKEKMHLLSMVADNVSSSVLITNAFEEIIWVNSAFTKLSGYTLGEALGRTPSQLLHGEKSSQTYNSTIRNLLKSGEAFKARTVNYHKAGYPYWIETLVTPVYDVNQELTHFIAIENNIENTVKKEAILEETLSQTQIQNKKLENFAYTLSHNFRGDASNIKGLINELVLESELKNRQKIIAYLQASSDQLLNSLDSLHQMLKESREVGLPVEKIKLRSFLSNAVKNNQNLLKGAKTRVEINVADNYTVCAYQAYLDSIVFNLFSNSVKYRNVEQDLVLSISAGRDGGNLWISFKDNGKGIDLSDEKRNNIFNLYQSYGDHPESKGLGLFIVKSQLEAMQGKIKIDSQVKRGTTVTIFLPTNCT